MLGPVKYHSTLITQWHSGCAGQACWPAPVHQILNGKQQRASNDHQQRRDNKGFCSGCFSSFYYSFVTMFGILFPGETFCLQKFLCIGKDAATPAPWQSAPFSNARTENGRELIETTTHNDTKTLITSYLYEVSFGWKENATFGEVIPNEMNQNTPFFFVWGARREWWITDSNCNPWQHQDPHYIIFICTFFRVERNCQGWWFCLVFLESNDMAIHWRATTTLTVS